MTDYERKRNALEMERSMEEAMADANEQLELDELIRGLTPREKQVAVQAYNMAKRHTAEWQERVGVWTEKMKALFKEVNEANDGH